MTRSLRTRRLLRGALQRRDDAEPKQDLVAFKRHTPQVCCLRRSLNHDRSFRTARVSREYRRLNPSTSFRHIEKRPPVRERAARRKPVLAGAALVSTGVPVGWVAP